MNKVSSMLTPLLALSLVLGAPPCAAAPVPGDMETTTMKQARRWVLILILAVYLPTTLALSGNANLFLGKREISDDLVDEAGVGGGLAWVRLAAKQAVYRAFVPGEGQYDRLVDDSDSGLGFWLVLGPFVRLFVYLFSGINI